MVEERNENLQNADGEKEQSEALKNTENESAENKSANEQAAEVIQKDEQQESINETTENVDESLSQESEEQDVVEDKTAEPVLEETTEALADDSEVTLPLPSKEEVVEDSVEGDEHKLEEEKTAEEVIDEIEQSMASESEEVQTEKVVEKQEHIPFLSYKDFDLKTLISEGQRLLSDHPVQKIKKHFDEIKTAFDAKVTEITQKFKEANPDETNTPDIPETKEFKYLWRDYREKYHTYRKKKQDELEANLAKRNEIIDGLKDVIDSTEYSFEERIKKFKEVQREWRSAGSIPSAQYADMWQTFKHHEERFYDLLDLDRDYRDKVFEENLKQKQEIIDKAKSLVALKDIHKVFKELQLLHKQWKEETGPVARDKREAIWSDFKDVTKQIHDKRRDFYKHLKEEFSGNLVKKQEIIEKLKELTAEIPQTHKEWQNRIKEIEKCRQSFYQIGYVPKKNREEIWDAFKATIKVFNKHKNHFYKSLKELQKENLDKKLELIKIAEDLQDSEEWETATQKFKEIQEEWKKIGHVPRKHSEKLWQQFRTACNHYFDRFYANVRKEKDEELGAFFAKKDYLSALKEKFKEVSEDVTYTIDDIKKIMQEWKDLGFVPSHKNYINVKFNRFINTLYDKLKIDKRELSFIKFKNVVDAYYTQEDFRKLDSEKRFVRQKIEAIEKEIQQLENNMMFIKSADKDNTFRREVDKSIANNTEILDFWKKKQKYLNSLKY